jgi:hypothetical protein
MTAMATEAGNTAERRAALEMVTRLRRERPRHNRRMTLAPKQRVFRKL